jgi:hypothetical protein
MGPVWLRNTQMNPGSMVGGEPQTIHGVWETGDYVLWRTLRFPKDI